VEDPVNRFGGTEAAYLASAFYSYSAGLVSKAARILNKNEDAEFYHNLSKEIKCAIRKEYFTATGRLAVNTQTAHVIALYMDLVPDEWKERIAFDLRKKLKETKYHLRTGFLGTPYLCRVLSEYGSNDISYRLLTNLDYPSWLYAVTMGATTIWERWNSVLPDGRVNDIGMNSLNHYSYGSIVEWMYRNAAGIQPIETAPGFRRFRLRPQPHYLLKSMKAEFMSPAGKIISKWDIKEDGSVSFYFKVPFNTTAELILPETEGTDLQGVHELECGEYTFSYKPAKPYRRMFGVDTSMRELLENDKAAGIVKSYLPEITGWMLFPMLAAERSICDFIREGLVVLDEKTLKEIDDKLKQVPVE